MTSAPRDIGMSEPGLVETVARFMHHRYEIIAREEGWVTQEKTRVPFARLPESNRRTMLRLAQEIIDGFLTPRKTCRSVPHEDFRG